MIILTILEPTARSTASMALFWKLALRAEVLSVKVTDNLERWKVVQWTE